MFSTPQLKAFHVVILREGNQILVQRSPRGIGLPVITIAAHTRPAEELTGVIRDRWNLKTYCLFTLPAEQVKPLRLTAVLELRPPCDTPPESFEWHLAGSLSPEDFAEEASCTVIERALTALNVNRSGELQGPFARTGWLNPVITWIEAQTAAVGLRLNGKFRQLNASPTFSLIRFETDGPALWFKAVGEPNLREYSITLEVNRLLSGFVPQVIAAHSGWNAWLSVEVSGNPLTGASIPCDWQKAAETLAHLQIASLGSALHLIEAGCKDLRPSSMCSVIGPFFDRVTELMAQQAKPTPSPLARHEMAALASYVRMALDELESPGFPSVLGHLDINSGNILVSKDRCVFLDWAEGCVAHPFLTFEYLVECFRKVQWANAEAEQLVRSAYVGPWRFFASEEDIESELLLSPLLAAFAYAVAILQGHGHDSTTEETARYLRSITRRMKREADVLKERRCACLP